MPYAPSRQIQLVVIHLAKGQEAPLGSQWVRLIHGPGGVELEGSMPDSPGVLKRYGLYPTGHDAEVAACDHAREMGCPLLYVERHGNGHPPPLQRGRMHPRPHWDLKRR